MRKEFVKCASRSTAKRRCPWAAVIAKVDGGFYCFESQDEYRQWKGNGAEYKEHAMSRIRETFETPFEQYRDRVGQRFTVLRKITKRNITKAEREEYDLECLPMYKIRFEDGHETSAWPEEIEAH